MTRRPLPSIDTRTTCRIAVVLGVGTILAVGFAAAAVLVALVGVTP